MEFLYDYGLFLAKAVTLVAAVIILIASIVGIAMRQKQGGGKGHLEITSLSDQLDDIKHYAREVLLDKAALKKLAKSQKKEQKAKQKEASEPKPRVFVIDFKGSMDAHEVDNLREEVTAILTIAEPQDEVLVRLESGGGVVHGYGLAASQLQRIKDKELKLTVAVDKVAASGGYMMACVADTVVSARFAIIGSIGVLAQLPNFNKLLKKNNIEFEQHTAGEFKRTLTIFGENTEAGREKFREELEVVHQMFKSFVAGNRDKLDIDKVATGEYWYGEQALELGLVDSLQTSDDYLLNLHPEHDIYQVKYSLKKNVAEKLGLSVSMVLERAVSSLWARSQHWFK